MQAYASADPAVQSAARWFWWIAGLSLVNSVLAHSGSQTSFVVGLGIMAIADAVFANAPAIAFVIDAIAVGLFFVIGLFAVRGKATAFYVGIGIYVLDALIYARFEDWMPVGFHALALYFIGRGLMQLRRQQGAMPA